MHYYTLSYKEADRRERIVMMFWLLSLILLATYFAVMFSGSASFYATWTYAILSLAWRAARTELVSNESIADSAGIDRGGCIRYRTRTSRWMHFFAPFPLAYFYMQQLAHKLRRTKS